MTNSVPPNLSIVLSSRVTLLYDADNSCKDCGASYYLDFVDVRRICVMCEFKRAGKQAMKCDGWTLCYTSSQVIATRL